jgi:hypothetical protein
MASALRFGMWVDMVKAKPFLGCLTLACAGGHGGHATFIIILTYLLTFALRLVNINVCGQP